MKVEDYLNNSKILFLGAHFDDVEFGCGALISKLCKNTQENIFVSVLSTHNKNADNQVQLLRDVSELQKSLHSLGVLEKNILLGDLSGQIFDSSTQKIREYLLGLKREINPEYIFFPSLADIHQDHATLAREAFRIFRNNNCFGYEIIRSSFDFSPNFYVDIKYEDINVKSNSIMMYTSQKTQSAAYYFSRDAIISLGQYRGNQIGTEFAEAYECYRNIL